MLSLLSQESFPKPLFFQVVQKKKKKRQKRKSKTYEKNHNAHKKQQETNPFTVLFNMFLCYPESKIISGVKMPSMSYFYTSGLLLSPKRIILM